MVASELEAYRSGDKPYEFKHTNGFFTTIDMNANDTAHAAALRAVKPLMALSQAQATCCEK